MPTVPTSDLTFRTALSGDWTEASVTEHVLNTVQRLLYMSPGSDIYNPDMGLDVMGRCLKCYDEGARDSEFEMKITKQLSDYTDIIPTAVIALYQNGLMMINMTATYNSIEFRLQLSSDPSTLSSQITRI